MSFRDHHTIMLTPRLSIQSASGPQVRTQAKPFGTGNSGFEKHGPLCILLPYYFSNIVVGQKRQGLPGSTSV